MGRTTDSRNGYGWYSIALHWSTATVVIAMWMIGSMSQTVEGDEYDRLVNMHMTTGVGLYLLLWFRIVWRFAKGHPGPLPRQNRIFFTIGKSLHFVVLVAIATMLLSGPLMVWTDGSAIEFFALRVPSPLGPLPEVQHVLRRIHGLTAGVILAFTVLHVLAAAKHVVVDRDGTLDKILLAHRDRGRNDNMEPK